jgi:hypothetical protein
VRSPDCLYQAFAGTGNAIGPGAAAHLLRHFGLKVQKVGIHGACLGLDVGRKRYIKLPRELIKLVAIIGECHVEPLRQGTIDLRGAAP